MHFDNASIVVYYCLIQMNIINLGILAHIDAGKTSVTENLLFASGATEKCGRVDNGDTITDSMDIERNVEELLFGLLRHLLSGME